MGDAIGAEDGDDFVLSSDAIRSLASERVLRRGISYFREQRVVDLQKNAGQLLAFVRGSGETVYTVRIERDFDGELILDCSCPFDWEPACKHIIASLLAHAGRQPVRARELAGAQVEALRRRVKRGRTEVEVEALDAGPIFGSWKARSLHAEGPGPAHTVWIHSLRERINDCDCADRAANMLGTCKHIEAVFHHLRNFDAAAFRAARETDPGWPVLVLDWSSSDGPCFAFRGAPVRTELRDLAESFIKELSAELPGRLPSGSEGRLKKLEQGGVKVNVDARLQLARLKRQEGQERRQREIQRALSESGGALPGLNAKLYPYQVDGVAFLVSAGRALLADDMGLGKTLQAIAATRWLMSHDSVERVLVVCPASLKQQWAREVERFTGLKTQVVDGSARQREVQLKRRAAFTVLNYELAVKDLEAIARDLRPDILILDEAQRIRNWRTQTATAIKSIETRYAFEIGRAHV